METQDLWLCAGQSNMELTMARLADDYPEEFDAAGGVPVSEFKIPAIPNFSGPQKELPQGARWTAASRESLSDFSGVAWFFARRLLEKNPGRRIGLVNASLGGTPVEAWMSAEALREAGFPEKAAEGRRFADAQTRERCISSAQKSVAEWEARTREEDAGLKERRQSGEGNGWRPLTLPGSFYERGAVDKDFCGVIWLRKRFSLDTAPAEEVRLWLGTIVDADQAFVNGVQAGATEYRYPPRKYRCPPGLLRAGENTLVLRVTCNDGQGEVTEEKPFKFFTNTRTIVELSGEWEYWVGCVRPPRPKEFFIDWQPTGLYNSLIAPLGNLPFKGVIWYQGESNTDNPAPYEKLFTAMVEEWRRTLAKPPSGRPLPFVWVQLPRFGRPDAPGWDDLRKAQEACLKLPATGMARVFEAGEWNDLHPVNKKAVGFALADAMLPLL